MLYEISDLYNYNISRVLMEDIPSIYDFIIKNDIDLKCYLTSGSIEEKINEALYCRGELFLKIQNQYDEVIGIIRGRIDFDFYNRLWLSLFKISDDIPEKAKKKIFDYFTESVSESYGIYKIEIGVSSEDNTLFFLKSCGFSVSRILKNYFTFGNENHSLIILNR